MQLEKIITLANARTRLFFLAMERSLRASGCTLPLWVIPYDAERFDLPKNAQWWEVPELNDWIQRQNLHPFLKKYQCFTTHAYQFVDTDVIFLRNPQTILAPYAGFITCCGHWHNVEATCTSQSLSLLKNISTTWQKQSFNAGQFACESILYTAENLKAKALSLSPTCVPAAKPYFSDQPALNLLVACTKIKVTNLTLSEPFLESSWAGDYPGEDFERYWKHPEKMPYLIHWAGKKMDPSVPISRLFFQYLTQAEKESYLAQYMPPSVSLFTRMYKSLRVAKNAFKDSFFAPL